MKRIACQNLTISYQRHPVVNHLNVEFKVGTTNAIIGPNGAGKSSVLKAILGETRIESGRVIIDGFSRSDIAYLPQVSEIDSSLPFMVEDVLLLGLLHKVGLCGGIEKNSDAMIDGALCQVGMSGFRKRYINELSRGQLQRVLLARIIMQNAMVIILDEPFNAMDNRTTDDLLQLIRKWQYEDGKTIIAVLHDLHQVACHFNYTLLIAQELIDFGKTQNVLNRSNLERAYKSSFMWLNENELCDLALQNTSA
jgi:zinc/manganese transport system ATP-binding protein